MDMEGRICHLTVRFCFVIFAWIVLLLLCFRFLAFLAFFAAFSWNPGKGIGSYILGPGAGKFRRGKEFCDPVYITNRLFE